MNKLEIKLHLFWKTIYLFLFYILFYIYMNDCEWVCAP